MKNSIKLYVFIFAIIMIPQTFVFGRSIGLDSSLVLLSKDEKGIANFSSEKSAIENAPQKPRIRRFDPTPIPTDEFGRYIDIFGLSNPTSTDNEKLATDSDSLAIPRMTKKGNPKGDKDSLVSNKNVEQVIGEQEPKDYLIITHNPTDLDYGCHFSSDFNYDYDKIAEEIPKNENVQLVDLEGQIVPTDSQGRFVYEEEFVKPADFNWMLQIVLENDELPLQNDDLERNSYVLDNQDSILVVEN